MSRKPENSLTVLETQRRVVLRLAIDTVCVWCPEGPPEREGRWRGFHLTGLRGHPPACRALKLWELLEETS